MPLLKRGTEIFPQGLFELPEADFPWWVAHVRSRQEKVLARHVDSPRGPFLPPAAGELRRAGEGGSSCPTCPCFRVTSSSGGCAPQRAAVLRSNVVVRLLEVPDQELLTRELRELRALQEAGATLVPYAPMAPGTSVRVIEGPFSRLHGKRASGTVSAPPDRVHFDAAAVRGRGVRPRSPRPGDSVASRLDTARTAVGF